MIKYYFSLDFFPFLLVRERVRMSKENILTVQSAVRGFHVYKAIWQPEEGEKLMCEHEENKKYDLFAINVSTLEQKDCSSSSH